MLTDQAEALRTMAARSLPRKAQLITITSGKGGVGKSHVAVNLAIRLSQLGRRVLLLDADLGTANADVLCDIRAVDNLAHVVAGRRSLADALVRGPGGFCLIPGASGLGQMAALSEHERTRILRQIRQLQCDFDIMLIDTGAGVGPNVLSFALGADQILAVTTPEPPAITDVYAVIKVLSRHRQDLDVALLVNMARDAQEARDVFDRVNAVSKRFLKLSLSDAGHVLRDPRVPLATRQRRPFVLGSPQSPASHDINRLAHRLDRHASEPQATTFLSRMRDWIAG